MGGGVTLLCLEGRIRNSEKEKEERRRKTNPFNKCKVSDGLGAILYSVVVDKTLRGRGVGRFLMESVENHVQQVGYEMKRFLLKLPSMSFL